MIIAVDLRCLWLGLAMVLMSHAARADDRQDFQALRAAAARHVASQVAAAHPDARATVEIGSVDPRLALPACPQPEFAISAGGNLWGAGNLAASCAAPRAWSLFLTYKVVLHGPALLAGRALPAGTVPGPGDLVVAEIDYAGAPGRYPRDPAGLGGASLTRPVARNSPITIDMLRVRPIIKPGQKVRIVVAGAGFQVSQEGIAQAQAGIGDSLRLKIAAGRYVQGTVQADGTVRVYP